MKKIILTVFAATSLLLYSTPSFAFSLSVGIPMSQTITGKEAGKSYSKTNLANLGSQLSGGRDPRQGNTVTGHGKSGMGRDKSQLMAQGGLASLWQR